MKIICNKKEYGEMIVNCANSQSCADCILYDICDITEGTINLVNLCIIREEEESEENT